MIFFLVYEKPMKIYCIFQLYLNNFDWKNKIESYAFFQNHELQ